MNNIDSVKHMCSLSKAELAKVRLAELPPDASLPSDRCALFPLLTGHRSWAANRRRSLTTSSITMSSGAPLAERAISPVPSSTAGTPFDARPYL